MRQLAGGAVVPDRCGEGEQALANAGTDAVDAASAVELEVELPFEGVVDRLDQLADGFEQVLARARRVVAVGRAQQAHSALGEEPVEFGGDVALAGLRPMPEGMVRLVASASGAPAGGLRP
jgi:hypothetical protein